MQESIISFDLENKSANDDATVILLPAMIRRKASQLGKFPKAAGDFKDETGDITITASNEGKAGQLAELDEFAAQLQDIQVIGATVTTSDLSQATMNFMQKDYPAFSTGVVSNIETTATLEAGKSAVNHSFTNPFKTGPLRAFMYKLKKGQKVNIALRIVMPDMSGPSSSLAVLPVQ